MSGSLSQKDRGELELIFLDAGTCSLFCCLTNEHVALKISKEALISFEQM